MALLDRARLESLRVRSQALGEEAARNGLTVTARLLDIAAQCIGAELAQVGDEVRERTTVTRSAARDPAVP